MWRRYKNMDKGSNIKYYKIKSNYISIRYQVGTVFSFNKNQIGENHFNNMCAYAKAGRHLERYIEDNQI